MKRFLIILTLFLFFINTLVFASSDAVKKDIQVITPDGFRLYASLEYPNVKKQTDFKTVVLLHSLGYNSEWWGELPDVLIKSGYAVLKIDLRGHGNSVYNSRLLRVSWKNLTQNAFAKYPDDVISVIEYINKENPRRHFFNEWAIIGSDLGAATGIIAANKAEVKPKTIVMLSPVVKAKGLYVPVSIAELNNVDFLSICGEKDTSSIRSQEYLKKFAQANFSEYTSVSKAAGILMIKNDSVLTPLIAKWVTQYLQ